MRALIDRLSTWFMQGRGYNDWMETFTGRRYYPANPRAHDVDILDIAHHLSMECRFTGAVSRFYSVAEHSVYVSLIVPPEHALVALMHDATEAYLKDMSRPVKRSLPDYRRLERLNWTVIAPVFGLPLKLPACVHEADNRLLIAERNALMPCKQGHWNYIKTKPANIEIVGMPPAEAEQLFLRRYWQLTVGNKRPVTKVHAHSEARDFPAGRVAC